MLGFIHVLIEALAALGRKYRLRLKREEAIRELNALDDRTLRDIGISRYDIPHVVQRKRC